MSQTERITEDELEVGEKLPWAVYDAGGMLLLKKGMTIQSEKQLSSLVERGLYKSTSAHIPAYIPDVIENSQSPFVQLSDFIERLKNAFVAILKKSDDAEKRILRIANDIQKLCASNPDALIGAVHLDHDHDYVTSHPVHVAILCEIFASYLGINEDQRRDIICAALTANISIVKLQSLLHHQSGPLSPQQKSDMTAHPLRSVELLDAAGITNTTWLRAIEQHHERNDGNGYPNGLSGNDIFRESKIIAICDIYTAMIVTKRYRDAHPASDILRVLFTSKGKEHDEELCLQLIKIMGVFPPGSFVKLDNGETAAVIKRAPEGQMWPHVASIFSPRGEPYANPLKRDCNLGGYRIKEMCSLEKSIPLNLHSLWDYS